MSTAPTVDVMIPAAVIQQRVAQIGALITDHYKKNSQSLVLVGLLRGSFIFVADLTRKISLPHEVDFMAISSYGNNTYSSGDVKILKDLDSEITGKDVLIVEDIADTGLTLSKTRELLLLRAPKSLAICALLDKPERREVQVHLEWVGFTIPDKFVVGYGIDYGQKYRHLDFIGVLRDPGAPPRLSF